MSQINQSVGYYVQLHRCLWSRPIQGLYSLVCHPDLLMKMNTGPTTFESWWFMNVLLNTWTELTAWQPGLGFYRGLEITELTLYCLAVMLLKHMTLIHLQVTISPLCNQFKLEQLTPMIGQHVSIFIIIMWDLKYTFLTDQFLAS